MTLGFERRRKTQTSLGNLVREPTGQRVVCTETEEEMWETKGQGRTLLSHSRGSPLKSGP